MPCIVAGWMRWRVPAVDKAALSRQGGIYADVITCLLVVRLSDNIWGLLPDGAGSADGVPVAQDSRVLSTIHRQSGMPSAAISGLAAANL